MSSLERRAAFAVVVAIALLAACVPPARRPAATRCLWIAGHPEPAFDPGGPPEPLRWSLERLLSRGLTEEDSSGAVVPAAARDWHWSPDSLVLTFRLRRLVFADGSPCRSEAFREALERGLARADHGSQAWLLAAVRGVERVRAGRPLPPLGIESPDDSTLVLRLARRDPRLPERLALPGVSAPWRAAPAGSWIGSAGLGPYRVLDEEPGRSLTLLRRRDATGATGPDTIRVRFQPSAVRVLAFLRAEGADLVWPVPSSLEPAAVPQGYRRERGEARPARVLLLVLRADVPPTSRAATRHALANALNREAVVEALGPRAERLAELIPGAGPIEAPPLDEAQSRDWMDRARLGRAFHVVLAYDADGSEAAAAQAIQGQWSGLGIYAELKPLRGAALARERLSGSAHVLLVAAQPWSLDPGGVLSELVMPLRGPAVGAFRTGWRTREFDGWILPGRPAPGPSAAAQARISDELVVLPLARLPWTWIERTDGPGAAFHPRFGPACATPFGVERSGGRVR